MSQKARFWDKHAQKYFASPISDMDAYERKLEMTRDYLNADSEVLEIGCGTGGTALKHAPHVKHIRATDISPGMLEIAREQAREQGIENVSFEEIDFDGLIADEQRYDVVLAMSILHLLEDRREALAKIHSLLKPGGVLVSSTACLGDRMWYMAPILALGRVLGFFPLVRIFTTRQLVRSLEEAGFTIEIEWKPEKAIAVFLIGSKATEMERKQA